MTSWRINRKRAGRTLCWTCVEHPTVAIAQSQYDVHTPYYIGGLIIDARFRTFSEAKAAVEEELRTGSARQRAMAS